MPKSMRRSTITNNVWYKSMLVGNDAFSPSAMQLISTQVVTSPVSSITFSSIPSTFSHLQIRAVARTDRSANADDLLTVRLNSDTGTSYASHLLYSSGNQVQATASVNQTYWRSLYLPGAGATANSFGGVILDLLDYKNTNKNTTMKALNGSYDYNWISLASGVWMNTAAVTSITFNMAITATNFVSGTRFSLYGING